MENYFFTPCYAMYKRQLLTFVKSKNCAHFTNISTNIAVNNMPKYAMLCHWMA